MVGRQRIGFSDGESVDWWLNYPSILRKNRFLIEPRRNAMAMFILLNDDAFDINARRRQVGMIERVLCLNQAAGLLCHQSPERVPGAVDSDM